VRAALLALLLAWLSAGLPAAPRAKSPAREIVPPSLVKSFERGVRALASDDMEGRGLGTAGLDRAADWLETALRRLGLPPAFPDGYRQTFRIKTGVAREDGNGLNGMPEEDWTPLGVSSSGEFEGELAFVGYGIEAPPIGYQELSGVDLTGKVALMLRYEPQERDEASPLDGRRPSRWRSASPHSPGEIV